MTVEPAAPVKVSDGHSPCPDLETLMRDAELKLGKPLLSVTGTDCVESALKSFKPLSWGWCPYQIDWRPSQPGE